MNNYNETLKENTGTMQADSIRDVLEQRIDLRTGKMILDYTDFEWGGELMPVSIHHTYNTALAGAKYTSSADLHIANFSAMSLGYGWKLNLMQSMVNVGSVYVYTDGDGNATEFTLGDDGKYHSSDDDEITYDSSTGIITQGSLEYIFEDERLVCIRDTDNSNIIEIVYNEIGLIESVADTAFREFTFTYNYAGFLQTITAPDNSAVKFIYNGNTLTSIQKGRIEGTAFTALVQDCLYISYLSSLPYMISANDDEGTLACRNVYEYYSDNRVKSVQKNYVNNSVLSNATKTQFSYASDNTVVTVSEPENGSITDSDSVSTTYSFNSDGDIVSSFVTLNDTENAENAGGTSPFNPYHSNEAHVSFTTQNILADPSFLSDEVWIKDFYDFEDFSASSCVSTDEDNAYIGRRSLIFDLADSSAIEQRYLQEMYSLPAGTYTFSAYVKVAAAFTCTEQDGGIYLGILGNDATVINSSERVNEAESGFLRIGTTFKLEHAGDVGLAICASGAGRAYVSCPQLEEADWYNENNLLENGALNGFDGWEKEGGVIKETLQGFSKSGSVSIMGTGYIKQRYYPKKSASTAESFIFSAWAKCVNEAETDKFMIRACINYTNGTTEAYEECFTHSGIWNKAEIFFSKKKFLELESIDLWCKTECSGNGACYIDDICLVRNGIEKNLTAEDFETDTETDTPAEDTETAEEFTEVKDGYGNTLTETIFKQGCEGALYRSFTYSANGNNRISETDHRGNTTRYEVDEASSRITSVTDRLNNITEYTYDILGRVTNAVKKDSQGNTLSSVAYTYDANGKLETITRGDGQSYAFDYNSAGLLVNAAGMVEYTYRSNSARLKAMTYANGARVEINYDRLGRIVSEKWISNDTVEKEYVYAYDKAGNLVRSVDKTALKEYTYTYRDGAVTNTREYDITLDSTGFVSSRTLVNAVCYTYNDDGQLVKKSYGSSGLKSEYTSTDNTSAVTHSINGTVIDTVTTSTDHLGRVVSDEIKVGNTPLITRTYEYTAGAVSDVHTENGKVPSTPTTNLVSKITVGDRKFEYTYDAEERIVSHVDYRGFPFSYTYDAQGQLVREVRGTTADTGYSYDAYGNILEKGDWDEENGVILENENRTTFNYDSVYRDRLVSCRVYNGSRYVTKYITYDEMGNPVSYLGKSMVWEKGRQLKSVGDNLSFTYNANGIRTSKTYNGVKHTYELEGTKVVRETWEDNEMIPLYDSSDSPIGLIYNRVQYWFVKNLQGDVVAIRDNTGYDVVRYNYDAWGKMSLQRDNSGTNLWRVNPFQYRGYWFDWETGFYYLQSRYYDPDTSRFINADIPEFIGFSGTNLGCDPFAYCENNPVNMVDPTGHLAVETMLLISLGAGIAIGLWELSKQKKKKEYKTAPGAGKMLMGVIAFFLGFLKGFSATFFIFLTGNMLFAFVAGIIALLWELIKGYWNFFAKGKSVVEGAATDAFIDGYSGEGFPGVIFDDIFSFIKGEKKQKIAASICEKIIELVF